MRMHVRLVRAGGAAALLAVLLGAGIPARELVWDATQDFSATSNPNGAWTSGWTAALGSPLQIYPDVTLSPFVAWYDQQIVQLGTPSFALNVSGQSMYGVPPGWTTLHPGCHAGEYSVLRWTAPFGGSYSVQAQFFAGDLGNTSAAILRDGDGANPLWQVPATGSNPAYAATPTLAAGETLDFAVGVGGDSCYYDNTPITVTISLSTVPGDLDCDGDVDFFDIDPFVARIGCPASDPDSCSTGCPWQNADTDADGDVDFFDIDPFVALLGTTRP